MEPRAHWDRLYLSRRPEELPWFEDEPAVSLALIAAAGLGPDAAVVDVGGGASLLVDRLLDRGFQRVCVVDVSPAALERARARLGERASLVSWVPGDARYLELGEPADLWHDRAVFHFLTEADDQANYLDSLDRAVRPGGHAVFGTFALDGPERCAGLDVQRYSAAMLAARLGDRYTLVRSREHAHVTPAGLRQPYTYALFRH
jgi:SAM-dependent methyltransferase